MLARDVRSGIGKADHSGDRCRRDDGPSTSAFHGLDAMFDREPYAGDVRMEDLFKLSYGVGLDWFEKSFRAGIREENVDAVEATMKTFDGCGCRGLVRSICDTLRQVF